jgi:hypothetical protein
MRCMKDTKPIALLERGGDQFLQQETRMDGETPQE